METISLVTIIVLAIIVIILIIVVTIQQFNLIKPSNCPLSKGNYGLLAGRKIVTSAWFLDVLSTCGIDGNQQCSSRVNSLSEASDYCVLNFRVCDVFNYTNGAVNILDPSGSIVVDDDSDLYYRQYKING